MVFRGGNGGVPLQKSSGVKQERRLLGGGVDVIVVLELRHG